MVEVYGLLCFGTGVFAHGGVIQLGKGLGFTRVCCRRVRDGYGRRTLRGALIGIEGAHPIVLDGRAGISHRRFGKRVFVAFSSGQTALEEVRESKAMETAVNWLDALSLGGFCIIGANAALVQDLGPLPVVAYPSPLYRLVTSCAMSLRQPVSFTSNLGAHCHRHCRRSRVRALRLPVPRRLSRRRSASLRFRRPSSRWRAWKQGLKLPMYADVNPEGDYISIAQKGNLSVFV